MTNKLYLIAKTGLRMIVCAEDEISMRRAYPWWINSTVNIKCIGIALPGEHPRVICASEYDDGGLDEHSK